ncbi:MAG: hypothetical protein CM1200mP30_03440 [Pseudomonadota bacterium]|nr:MAG: hypothetical protein CM1200mP30_03440 [Pseudomonadota bacterium]
MSDKHNYPCFCLALVASCVHKIVSGALLAAFTIGSIYPNEVANTISCFLASLRNILQILPLVPSLPSTLYNHVFSRIEIHHDVALTNHHLFLGPHQNIAY